MSLEPADETVGGAVVVEFSVSLGKFREDLLGELLTEFNTPLVVAVDVPNHALGEGLAVHQGFGLGKEVGEELLVMVADLVVAVCRGDEVARNHLGALVDELVEGVLAVRTRFTPEDRAGLVVHALGITVNGLAVGFHVGLLEVGSEAVEVLVVGEHGVAGSAKEVVVPHADEGEDNGQVLVDRSSLEMLIHFVGALVELHVVVETDAESNGKISLGVPRTARAGRAIFWGQSTALALAAHLPEPSLATRVLSSRGHYP